MSAEDLSLRFEGPRDPEELLEENRDLSRQNTELRAEKARLTEENNELDEAVTSLTERNQKLSDYLQVARDQIASQNDKLKELSQTPNPYGAFVGANEDGTVDIVSAGRKTRVGGDKDIIEGLQPGQEVWVNENMAIIGAGEFPKKGDIATLKEILDDGEQALVVGHTDEETVVTLGGKLALFGESEDKDRVVLKPGDSLVCDLRNGFAFRKIEKAEVTDLQLEKVPDISYEDIGGLDSQVAIIRKAVERPYLRPDLYAKYNRRTPKGVLLYGPPGCGKTMVAKAVAHNLAIKAKEQGKGDGNAYFLNIKGPELLNKYVGETERHIRLVFQKAREKSLETGSPVIIFFDEMESMFRARGSGVSSDVESTIVPQILAEMDGAAEGMENIIVIGASNRQDLIDPALLRNGRLDARIKIDRPNEKAALDIFSKHLTPETPIHKSQIEKNGGNEEKTVEAMIASTVEQMYAETPANKFLEVTFANGEKGELYFKDFISGAMIEGIVNRARDMAIDAEDVGQEGGIKPEYLRQAVIDEYKENEDLPNTTNPDDWSELSSKGIKGTDRDGKVKIKGRGQRIVYIRTIAGDDESESGAREISNVGGTGQYL